jgi:hypothetical protein
MDNTQYLPSLLQNRISEVTAVNHAWGISAIQIKDVINPGPFINKLIADSLVNMLRPAVRILLTATACVCKVSAYNCRSSARSYNLFSH